LQLVNILKEKNPSSVFAILETIDYLGVVENVLVSFFLMGYTHENIDQRLS